MSDLQLNDSLLRVLALMRKYPSISSVLKPFYAKKGSRVGKVIVDAVFDVEFPSRLRASEESPTGVKQQETVRFYFPKDFPLAPPEISLRPDFNRNLPHMQPWLVDGCPVPCIFDGELSELLQQEGMLGILNQTVSWLEKAASDTLIDSTQGWEPVRRDSYADTIVANAQNLRKLVKPESGYRFFKFHYHRFFQNKNTNFIHGQILDSSPIQINKKTITKIREYPNRNAIFRSGQSLAVIVWSGKSSSGELIVNNKYLPETVLNIHELIERAKLYGCEKELRDSFNSLKNCLSEFTEAGPFILAVILLTRRPYNIIGSQSCIELCPYVLDIHSPILFKKAEQTRVKPAGHLENINLDLLMQMSGISSFQKKINWTLIGAGSLGSKLALHLGRAGQAPDFVVDKAEMRPHNAARHALIPLEYDNMQLHWLGYKAQLLCNSLQGLSQKTMPIIENAVNLIAKPKVGQRICSKNSWAIVNSTASLTVREALASTDLLPTRVVEVALFSDGKIGLIAAEGEKRNPNVGNLISEYYALIRENKRLSNIIFTDSDSLSRQNIGQGCGSLTMPMSDGRISIFAASMAEYLLNKQAKGLDKNGEIIIGQLSDDGLSLQWQTHLLPPVKKIKIQNGITWHVHIHARALKKIEKEIVRFPSVETGGVLMGRFSEASHTFYIVDVIGAPEDSKRSMNQFELGTKGLNKQLADYSSVIDWSLYCLGTWHSHLVPSEPSSTDQMTAANIALARITPSVLLIHTPKDFKVLVADSANP